MRPSHSVGEVDVDDKDWASEISAPVVEDLDDDVDARGEACGVGS